MYFNLLLENIALFFNPDLGTLVSNLYYLFIYLFYFIIYFIIYYLLLLLIIVIIFSF